MPTPTRSATRKAIKTDRISIRVAPEVKQELVERARALEFTSLSAMLLSSVRGPSGLALEQRLQVEQELRDAIARAHLLRHSNCCDEGTSGERYWNEFFSAMARLSEALGFASDGSSSDF